MNQGYRRLSAPSQRTLLAPPLPRTVLLGLVGLCMLVSAAVLPAKSKPDESTTRTVIPFGVPRTTEEIKVDAVLSEPAWVKAVHVPLKYETRPGENTPAPVETTCLVTYDNTHVYVAFIAYDSDPKAIRARLTDRDKAFNDDFVGVVLDTFNDERRAFEFFVNPRGVQMDLFQDDVSGREDVNWDAIWSSAGRITEEGYIVEFAIPFQQLRFPSGAGEQVWGFDAIRFYPRSDRTRIASQPMDRNVSCYLCQISKIEGFEGATPGRNLELVPTLTAGRQDERTDFPDGDIEDGDGESQLGLTASWGVTPSMVLGLALNPDFSQVEADVAQLDINTTFTLFFPERRPFFLEGADFFRTPFNAVFTRNVSAPDWGVRLTGKQKKNGIGTFVAQDSVTNLVFPGSTESDSDSFDFGSDDAVLRYRRDLGKASSLGMLFTGRTGDGYKNYVAGVDGLYRFRESDSIRFQVLGSQSLYPDEIAEDFDQPMGDFDGQSYLLSYVHDSRNLAGWVRYEDVGEGFRADMGFMPQVDFREAVAGLEHHWWGESGDWYNRLSAGGEYSHSEDQSGQLLSEEYDVWGVFQGPLQTFVWLDVGTRNEYWDGELFDLKFIRNWFAVRPNGILRLEMFSKFGDQIDFDNTRPGREVSLNPEISLNLGLHLRTDLDYNYQRMNVEEGRLFEAHLSQLRIVYQINIRTFVRAILQYQNIQRNPELYVDEVDPRSQDLFSQFLFSYKLNPRTVVFLGYSDAREGDQDIALTQSSRTVFLKLGYSWVL